MWFISTDRLVNTQDLFKERNMKKLSALILLGVVAMVFVACSSEEETTSDVIATTSPMPTQQAMEVTKTIVDIAVEDGRFETLVAALQAAELVSTLSGEGPFTVFAPTDDAFAALPDGVVAGLLEDIPSLTEVLTYHVVSGTVLAETVVGLTSAATLQGEEVTIKVIDPNRPPLTIGNVMIDGATVLITDIIGSNGVIHVIDSVILPTKVAASLSGSDDSMDSMEVSKTIVDIAVEDGRFGTLVTALQAAGLVDTLAGDGPFTVFAPTDDAFAALPDGVVAGLLEDIPSLTEVLTYHVVAGSVLAEQVVGLDSATTLQGEDVMVKVVNGAVMIDEAQVVITDIIGSNGVIHVIDSVILPTEIAASLSSPEVTTTIVDIAVQDGRFETLVAALQAADLVSTLSGEGPFTVFAPTDDAFAALPEGTVDNLLADIPALTNVLTYHVVAGSVLAEQVAGLSSAKTLQGSDVGVSVMGGNVIIDNAMVVIADIIGSNGVIHVIDKVLLP